MNKKEKITQQYNKCENYVESTFETTIDDLNSMVVKTSIISKSYDTLENFKNLKSDFNLENIKKINKNRQERNEYWLKYKDTDLEVSNFGRVKLNDESKHIHDLKNLLDDNNCFYYSDTGHNKGYLYLRDWKEIQEKLNFTFKDDYIYQMVANTWLIKPKSCNACGQCPLEIHHITNDGYDNSIWNLIYLTKCQHSKINHKTRE